MKKFKDSIYLILLGVNIALLLSLYIVPFALPGFLSMNQMIFVLIYVALSTPFFLYLNNKKVNGGKTNKKSKNRK